MNQPDMNEQSPPGLGSRDALTAEWVSALVITGVGGTSSAALAEVLRPLAESLLATAREVPFHPERAEQIGAGLVAAGLIGADTLGRSLTVIGRHVAWARTPAGTPDVAPASAPGGAPASAVAEAVAAGYVGALVAYHSRHDPLTGLANRALLLDRLAGAAADPTGRIGLCYVDLDGFKPINDTLGHDIGDGLLVAAARRLGYRVAGLTATVARIGGDTFALLVQDPGGTDVMVALAREVLTRIEQPFTVGGHRLGVTASIGIVERPAAATGAAEVLKDAERALLWARADGPGHWAVYDPARSADDNTRMRLTASMRSALEAGQFSVLYQPIVGLPGGELRGAEALLRWNHPALGVLAPEAFIALAEESGLIAPLGRWVMEAACWQAAQWQQVCPGRAPFISVNLSPQQAQDPGFVGDVARILAETGLPPELLQLELTESALVEADSRPLETLQKLSAMGVRIAADDFGSGYSNLAYLRRLPVDALKLSASFIREVWPDGPADEPIISALAGLAHTLGLNLTVEGVETSAQASRLAALGCDSAQGWYFAPAVPGHQLTAVLREELTPRFPSRRCAGH
jgi:diguanylate cyclase (GGDEF)-like protein